MSIGHAACHQGPGDGKHTVISSLAGYQVLKHVRDKNARATTNSLQEDRYSVCWCSSSETSMYDDLFSLIATEACLQKDAHRQQPVSFLR